jgi:hypothetical protein
MINEPQKPIMQPYLKSIELYYAHQFWGGACREKALESFIAGKPICWNCNGLGKIKDPSDYDVVEGLKFARLIKCPMCIGGIMPIQYILGQYKDDLVIYKNKILKYKKELSLYNSIVSKLTQEELNYVKNNI